MANKKGIDVSKHQGKILWDQVKQSDVEFAICRAGYGNSENQKDSTFDYNITNALANGIECGAYWFSYAISPTDAIKEANVFLKVVEPYRNKLKYPLFFDFEYDSISYAKKQGINMTNALIDGIANTFMATIKNAGWEIGIYTNLDFIKSGKFSTKTTNSYPLWLADYTGAPDVNCTIQQIRSDGIVDGISTKVDMNVCYKDFVNEDTSFVSDTTCDFNINKGASYQFKITAKKQPVFAVGTDGVFTSTFIKQEGNNYFYKITAVGTEGKSAGIYVNGHKVCVASITQSIPSTKVDIDTTADVMMDYGSYYIVKTVSPTPVKLTYGTSNVVTIVPFPRTGNEQLFAIVSIGKSGAETGIYTCTDNEQPLKRFKFKVK